MDTQFIIPIQKSNYFFYIFRYTKNISKMVAHAANAYFTTEDMEMIHQVKDVKKWSSRMREPMEKIYGEDYFPVLWEEWVDAITKIATSTPDKNICREVLPQIRCPTLIIHGSKDAMVSMCTYFAMKIHCWFKRYT